ncbi:MAG: EamA family transporter [Bacteroidetes bacterium]|nr:EamA family transporter [Bacteroidota bacterium]
MRPVDYLIYGIVLFGWSTSWYPLTLQLGVVAPEVSLTWRFTFATILMFVITRIDGHSFRFSWRYHLRFLCFGFSFFSCNFVLFYYGGMYAPSGLLAVVLSTSSLLNVLMVAGVSRKAPPRMQLGAAIVGLGGIALIFWPQLQMSPTALISLAFCFGGTLLFCVGNLISVANQRDGVPVLAAISWGMFYGTLCLVIISLARGHEFIIDPSPTYLGSLVWLTVMSSIVALYCYVRLIGSIGPVRAAYATVVFPVFALMISAQFEDFIWTSFALTGLGLVIAGNIMMIRALD